MRELVRQAMLNGAFGLSSGLFYTPGAAHRTSRSRSPSTRHEGDVVVFDPDRIRDTSTTSSLINTQWA